jgi:hypothetical protein
MELFMVLPPRDSGAEAYRLRALLKKKKRAGARAWERSVQ